MSKINIELFKAETHYEIISKWWKDQRWPIIPLSHLPKVGFVIYFDQIPVIAGWLYKSDSAFAHLEWIVANPEVRGFRRSECFKALVDRVKRAANEMGFKSIITSVQNRSLIKRLKSSDFTVTDEGMTNLIFNIKGGE